MKVLLLTPRPQLLIRPLLVFGDEYVSSMAEPSAWPEDIDFVVSFGYRHIIKEPYLTKYKNRIINIHISMLPWNRGADPNLWSWYDNTPKGVSVHLVRPGVDSGPTIMQMQINKWSPGTTLRSSYDLLHDCAGALFDLEWHRFRSQHWFLVPHKEEGTYHKSSDKDAWFSQLPLGWDSPVEDVIALGEKNRAQ